MPLRDTLRQTIIDHALLKADDKVLVAVSGGPDSLSLLHALDVLKDKFGLASLTVAHLDHRLRGAESAEDSRFVATFCTERGLRCYVGAEDTAALAAEEQISIQQAARVLRLAFLTDIASVVGANKIATAHTQDDQVETILMNILRGTGLDGLQGIPIRRGLYIRPLLETSRAEVEAYCQENSLTPRLDSSNLDSTHYTRNKIRLELLPQLAQDYNPHVRDALLRLSQIATRDADYVQNQAEALFPALILAETTDTLTLDCRALRALHPAMLRAALRAALRTRRGTLEGIAHIHLEPVCAAILGQRRLPFGLTTPPPHCTMRVTQRRLTLRSL